MTLVRRVRRRARDGVAPLFCAAAMIYFAYHALEGDRGLFAWIGLSRGIAQLQATAADLAVERHQAEVRASSLRPDNLDLDMLDERARFLLNLAGDDEVVILLNRPGAPSR